MRSLPFFFVTLALVLGGALAAMAAPLANCAKKVESFDLVVDYSGSMLMDYSPLRKIKLEVAKDLIVRINDKIPALGFDGGLHTVAPASTIVRHGAWDRAALNTGVARLRSDLDILGRGTPLGDSLKAQENTFAGMKRKAAVILFTDGESNRGADPAAVVQNLYQAQRDLVIHIVSFADTKVGKDTLNKIAALNKDSVHVEAQTLSTSETALDNFVMTVFCAGDAASAPRSVAAAPAGSPAAAAVVAGAPAAAAVAAGSPAAAAGVPRSANVIVLRGVNFAYNSDVLDNKAVGLLKETAAQVKGTSGKIVLEGWTDSVGSDDYNMQLSQRRADAVKSYLIKQGVPAARLSAIGKGKSARYDNQTDEGRYMNRRTELLAD
jgi:OOP family OmpA-OmpF porin